MEKSNLYGSSFTQPYLFEDLIFVEDVGGVDVIHKPNEITMLKNNNLPPELKERLGLVLTSLSSAFVSGDVPNRYRQSLSERQYDAQNALDELDDEKRRLLELQKSQESQESHESQESSLDSSE